MIQINMPIIAYLTGLSIGLVIFSLIMVIING